MLSDSNGSILRIGYAEEENLQSFLEHIKDDYFYDPEAADEEVKAKVEDNKEEVDAKVKVEDDNEEVKAQDKQKELNKVDDKEETADLN